MGDHGPQLPSPPLCPCGHPAPPSHPCSEARGLAPGLNTRQKIFCRFVDAWQASLSLQSLKSENLAGLEGMTARHWSIKSDPPPSRSAASRNRGRFVSSCCVSLPCLSHTSCSSGTRSRKQMYYKVAKLAWKLLTTLRILKPPGYVACILPQPRCPENQLGWLWEECTPVSWSWKASSALRVSLHSVTPPGTERGGTCLLHHEGPDWTRRTPIPSLPFCRTWLLGCWLLRAIPNSVSEPFLWSFSNLSSERSSLSPLWHQMN